MLDGFVPPLIVAAVSIGLIAILAVGGSWEAYENTDTVIERYRAVTISFGYYGDSVLNSMSDIIACAIGFRAGVAFAEVVTVSWVVVVEIAMARWIRDNLTLNLIMLVYPLDAIRRWQSGL
jgi:hypothetical protein